MCSVNNCFRLWLLNYAGRPTPIELDFKKNGVEKKFRFPLEIQWSPRPAQTLSYKTSPFYKTSQILQTVIFWNKNDPVINSVFPVFLRIDKVLWEEDHCNLSAKHPLSVHAHSTPLSATLLICENLYVIYDWSFWPCWDRDIAHSALIVIKKL